MVWASIIEKIYNNPIWGHGFGQNFDVYIPQMQTAIVNSPHNYYLAMLYELGAVGLISFFVAIINYLKNLWRVKITNETDDVIRITSIVVVFCALSYWFPYASEKDIFTWSYLGLGLSLLINKNSESGQNEN